MTLLQKYDRMLATALARIVERMNRTVGQRLRRQREAMRRKP